MLNVSMLFWRAAVTETQVCLFFILCSDHMFATMSSFSLQSSISFSALSFLPHNPNGLVILSSLTSPTLAFSFSSIKTGNFCLLIC